MNVDIINTIIKSLLINFLTIYISSRIINFKTNNMKYKICMVITLIVSIVIYLICRLKLPVLESSIIVFAIQSVFFSKITKNKLIYSFGIIFISSGFSYLISTIFSPIIFFVSSLLKIRNSIIISIFIAIVSGYFSYRVFTINRFKNGIKCIYSKINTESLEIFFINITAIILIVYGVISNFDKEIIFRIYVYFIILGIVVIGMIQKSITLLYKQSLLENTLKDYENIIKEKDEKITRLTDENFKINKLNHEFYNRQKSLELKVEKALANMNFEISEEFDLGDKIIELSKEFTTKVKEIKTNTELPKTNIEEIDDMFLYMQSECKENGIEFLLQINGNINYLINNIIDKTKLVTLIGDHLRDAIIAINYTKNKYKSILAILGIKDDTYEFCIYDSGIEFDIETFNKLGLEPITTHKESGGSGIGFVTTFETLNQINASLIIEEKNELTENKYTKSITFKFDNKKEFKIISYRAKKIREKLTNKIFDVEELKNA